MRVLITGANGFVGSHILDVLREAGAGVRIILRRTSNTRFIQDHLPHVQVHYASLDDPAALQEAMRDTDCVVHCAGKTKVLRLEEYYEANQRGTRSVVDAANQHRGSLRHLIHISSRAVSGPSAPGNPSREDAPPAPISEYGKSKQLGELEVTGGCQVPYTILRPSAVYGPRDADFLHAFRAVRMRLMPLFDGGRQEINLVYARDVAGAVLRVMGDPRAFGNIYNVASPRRSTTREFLEEIARQMHVRPVPVHLPSAALYPVCLAQEIASRLTGRPGILSRQRFCELRAAGWACSVERIRHDFGFVADTPLSEGVRQTTAWYERHGWL